VTATRLYHLPGSRSNRVLWLFEEIGEPFEVTVLTREDRGTAEHRARHPLGRVPVIEDDAGFTFESAAIMLALADRHPESGLSFPLGTHERDLVYQWVLFSIAELERTTTDARTAADTNPERQAAAAEEFAARQAVVEEALAGRDFLVGDQLTVADIAVGSVLVFAQRVGVLADTPNTTRYLSALTNRPARQAAYPAS